MTDQPQQPTESMRKKPIQARAWKTIHTIFEATIQILQAEGERRLTTNRVAERAGFSIGTLYQYFPSMDAVLLAMIEMERRRVTTELDALLTKSEAANAHPRDVLRDIVRLLVTSFGTGNQARLLLLKRAWTLDHTPPVVAVKNETSARILLFLQRRNHPDVPPPSPAGLFVMTRAILGAIRDAVLEESSLPGTPEFEDLLVRLALDLLSVPGLIPQAPP